MICRSQIGCNVVSIANCGSGVPRTVTSHLGDHSMSEPNQNREQLHERFFSTLLAQSCGSALLKALLNGHSGFHEPGRQRKNPPRSDERGGLRQTDAQCNGYQAAHFGADMKKRFLEDGAMNRTTDKRDLVLAALFHRRIDHAKDAEKGAQIEALVVKLGGDRDAAVFRRYTDSLGAAQYRSSARRRSSKG